MYDMANPRGFRGLPGTNVTTDVIHWWADGNSTAFTKVKTGTETVFIPYYNQSFTVKVVDFYNDYVSSQPTYGSNYCCPNPFSYGTGLSVTGSTLYTCQIIFKSDTGYYNPNYIYIVQYGSSGYIAEGGQVNGSRLESLGDGWYHAWGQFTTNASTTIINTFLFHYEYNTWNRIRVLTASITAGSTIHRPEHLIAQGGTRGSTVAAGGGLADLVGAGHFELVNGVAYSSTNGGSMYLDGTNDYLVSNTSTATAFSNTTTEFTLEFFFLVPSNHTKSNPGALFDRYRFGLYYNYSSNICYFTYINKTYDDTGNYSATTINSPALNPKGTWNHVVVTYTKTGNNATVNIYANGSTTPTTGTATRMGNYPLSNAYIGNSEHLGSTYYWFEGNIATFKVYGRALTATEVVTNYNSLKVRSVRQTTRNTTLVRQAPKGAVYGDVVLFLDPANRSSYSPGSSKWYDLSPNRREVTFYTAGGGTHTTNAAAPPPFSTDGKGSFVFDGINDFGKLNSTFTTTTNITVSVWVKTTATGERGILSHCSGGPVNEGYSLYDGKMKYWYYSGSWQTLDGTTVINDGAWKNLVWVKTGTNMKMYINGILDKEATLVASITSTFLAIGTMWGPCNSLNYGAGSDYYSTSFSGNMGPLKVWTRALSTTEVTEIYERFKGRFGESITGSGLITHVDSSLSYPGSGATWTDLSGSGNNVTLYNSPAYSNGVLSFDGVTEYFVSNVNVGAANTSFTFGGFVKVKASTVANSFIFSNYHATSGVTPFYAIAYNGSGPTFLWFRDSTGNTNTQGAQVNLSLNQWYYIVCVRNHATNQILLYVNGVLCDTTTFAGSHAVNNGLNLGGILHVNSTYINSDMGSLKVYNRALTSNEVMRNFMLSRSRFGVTGTTTAITKDLMMYFDAKLQSSYSGNIWYDISGSANHATLVGSPTWNSEGYLVFDGVDDRATIPFNSTSMAAWSSAQTVIFWAYHTFTTERRNLWNQAYGGYGTWTHEPGSYFNYFYGDGGADTGPYTSLNSTVGSSTPTGVWNMYAITRDTSTVRFYINGSLDTSQANPYADLATTTAAVSIAYGYTGVYWAGRIGVVMAYTRALTAADILWNYNFYKGRFGRA
jgi:hypothetical protein